MIDTRDRIIQDIAGQLSEKVFNAYCHLIFREVENILFQANSYPSTVVSSYIESSKDLLSEVLEGLSILQTPILPTYIPHQLSIANMRDFLEVETNAVKINPTGIGSIHASNSLDMIDTINKQIERDFAMALRKKITLANFVPYVVLRPVLEVDPFTYTFVYKTSVIYSYRTTQLKYYNPSVPASLNP